MVGFCHLAGLRLGTYCCGNYRMVPVIGACMCACVRVCVCACVQLQNLIDQGTAPASASSRTAYTVLVYCKDGVMAPPSVLRRLLAARQQRACDRAVGLQALLCALALLGRAPGCQRELLMVLQPTQCQVST